MTLSSTIRIVLPISAFVVAVGVSAQSFNGNFSMTATFPTFPPYSYSSDYVQCVAPAERQKENDFVNLQSTYNQQKLSLVEQQGRARADAWMIPERSARSRAVRDVERAYRDNLRALDRWFKDQEREIKRTFNDAEDACDHQFDDDIDSPDDNNGRSSSSFSFSSRYSSFSYSSFGRCGNKMCEEGEGIICPRCDTFPCDSSCAIGSCPQDCGLSTSSSSSSSRFSQYSNSSVVNCQTNDRCLPVATCNSLDGQFAAPGQCGTQAQQQAGYYCCNLTNSNRTPPPQANAAAVTQNSMQSCGCQTTCDASGNCMAVCPAEC